jgi:hypothetical protein
VGQTHALTPNQIKQVLEELRKQLPMDVWTFKKMVEERLGCEYRYDESVEPDKRLELSNAVIYIYRETFNDVVCNDTVTLSLRDVILVDDYGLNMIYLIHYEV